MIASQDPRTGQTALRVAAAAQARQVVRALLATGKYDFLIRDKHGRLASKLAYLYGDDPALARLLTIKEGQAVRRL
jgi:ankyrin repeat protein